MATELNAVRADSAMTIAQDLVAPEAAVRIVGAYCKRWSRLDLDVAIRCCAVTSARRGVCETGSLAQSEIKPVVRWCTVVARAMTSALDQFGKRRQSAMPQIDGKG